MTDTQSSGTEATAARLPLDGEPNDRPVENHGTTGLLKAAF
jgi:hypothetical protein